MSSQTDTEEKNSCAEIKGDNNIAEGNAKSESEPASEAARKTYTSSGAATPEIPSPTVKTPQKLGHHWLAPEDGGHHLTIGSHPSADWMRRFALDKTRKTSEPEVSSKSGEGLTSYRSTDCLPKDSSSSDSDLLRSAPPWSRSKFRFGSEREKKPGGLVVSQSKATTPTSPVSTSGQESATSSTKSLVKAPDPAEIAAKKQRIKRSLMKRARSVAIFSLKLKERRAVMEKELPEAPKTAKETKPVWGVRTEGTVGGELGCIPIEMLISVDDIAKDLQRRQNPST
ncbi:hypothetical protein RUM43_005031 [Polyplax serrata]|uniref:Uncharacterized protein n=1 Tax=Polyplax serrata TaxID=468196 RepID=A0AAN8SCI6_POLSC